MTRSRSAALSLLAAGALALATSLSALTAAPLAAQEPARTDSAAMRNVLAQERHADAPAADHANPCEHEKKPGEKVDIITPHITNSPCVDLPYWKPPFVKEVRAWPFAPVHLGPLDITPTKHTWMLILAAVLCMATLLTASAAHARHHHESGTPRGFAAGIESMVLYLRNEVVLPNVGHHGDAYVPFCLTLFFFILFANLLGLIPYGATATGNIAVTATLAIITFFVVEISGMRALGSHYLSTIFYWNKELSMPMRILLFLIMTPVELATKFTKPIALAIRLFANMTAGHIVVLALLGLIFLFGPLIGIAPFFMAVAIMMLELFVAFLQAFIFTLLTAVFIGQIRESHH